MKNKTTKSALISSLLCLALCVTMLVGSTFAWFTDTATTGVNKIVSGNLDIALEYWDGDSWEDAEDIPLDFVKAKGHEDQTVLFEPGATYEMPKLRMVNKGNLAAKCLLRINGIKGDEKLFEALEFSTKVTNIPQSILDGTQGNLYAPLDDAPLNIFWGTPDGNVIMDWALAPNGEVTPSSGHTDTSAEFTVVCHMKEEAGNEYKGLAIEGVTVQLVATQSVYEYDSFGRYYDDDLPYPMSAVNSEEFNEAVASVPDGGTIVLAPNTVYEVGAFALGNKNVTIVGAEGTVLKPIGNASADYAAISIMGADGALLNVKNVTIVGTSNADGSRGICFSGQQNSGVTLVAENCTIENVTTGIYLGGVANAVIKNCTFKNCLAAIGGTESLSGTLTVDNCVFDNNSENIGWAGTGSLVISSCPTCESFVDWSVSPEVTVPVTGGNYKK